MSKPQDLVTTATLEMLRQIDVIGSRISSMEWNESASNILQKMIDMDVVKEKDVLEVLHERLLEIGRESFNEHRDRGTAPDHTYSPEALAYAMREDEFTEKEVSRIAFDHEKNAFEFVEKQLKGKEDFSKIVLNQLLEYRDRSASMHKDSLKVCVDH
ncbi:hypothetical protein JXR01_02350 [Candidatus Kaiserbacteria bacterium]|nr:MAG: hypothetical protein JXR01_02350 [Candidatus Kaiserbacteria bacterium]